MSLITRSQKMRNEYSIKQAKIKDEATTKLKEEAVVWVDEILTPYLLENGHLGQIEITEKEARFSKISNPVYQEEIRNIDIVILNKGNYNGYYYLGLSWLPEHKNMDTITEL